MSESQLLSGAEPSGLEHADFLSQPQHIDVDTDDEVWQLRKKVATLESEVRLLRGTSRGLGSFDDEQPADVTHILELQLHLTQERNQTLQRQFSELLAAYKRDTSSFREELSHSQHHAAEQYAEARLAQAKNWSLQHHFRIAMEARDGSSWSYSITPSTVTAGVADLRRRFCILCEQVWRKRIEDEAMRYLLLRAVQSYAPCANDDQGNTSDSENASELLLQTSFILDSFAPSALSFPHFDDNDTETLSGTSLRFQWWLARLREEAALDDTMKHLLGECHRSSHADAEMNSEAEALLPDFCVPPPLTRSIGISACRHDAPFSDDSIKMISVASQSDFFNAIELEQRAATLASALDVEREVNQNAVRKLCEALDTEMRQRKRLESEGEELRMKIAAMELSTKTAATPHRTASTSASVSRKKGDLFAPSVLRHVTPPPSVNRRDVDVGPILNEDPNALFQKLSDRRDYILRLETIARQTPDAAMRQRLLREIKQQHEVMLRHGAEGVFAGARTALYQSPHRVSRKPSG